MQALTSVELGGLDVFSEGKVRNVYDLGEKLLVVASDRISAFDYVLPTGIPDKGKILTAVSAFWFKQLEDVSKHHMITCDADQFPPELQDFAEILRHRSMLVWKAKRVDVECIVRGYLSGSAWKEYSRDGTVAGYMLPAGLRKGAKLDVPIFTPSTKADDGHDRNITVKEMSDLAGAEVTERLMERSLRLFEAATTFAESRDITIVDTKFEFGYLGDELILIDEVFTPDSSRFWIRETPDSEPINVDKQFIRDFLEGTGWDKNSPPPTLPEEVAGECRRRYMLLYERLVGERPPWEA